MATPVYLNDLKLNGVVSHNQVGNVYTLIEDYSITNLAGQWSNGKLVIATSSLITTPATLIIPFGKTISFVDNLGVITNQVIDIPVGNTLVNQGGTITSNTQGNKIQVSGTFINMGNYSILPGTLPSIIGGSVEPSKLELYNGSVVKNSCGGIMDGITISFKGNGSSLTNQKNGSITRALYLSNDSGVSGVTITNYGNLSLVGSNVIEDIGTIANHGLITVTNNNNTLISNFNTSTTIRNYGKFVVESICVLRVSSFFNDNTYSIQNEDLPYDEGGNGPSFIIDDINNLRKIGVSATFTNMANTLIVNQTGLNYNPSVPKVTITNETGGRIIPSFVY